MFQERRNIQVSWRQEWGKQESRGSNLGKELSGQEKM